MKEFFVVTHTQATHHVGRLVGGWYDSELTEKGITDAGACGNRLLDLGFEDVPIISSDWARTQQTAQALADCLNPFGAVHELVDVKD